MEQITSFLNTFLEGNQTHAKSKTRDDQTDPEVRMTQLLLKELRLQEPSVGWEYQYPSCPKQQDGSSCGPFICKFAHDVCHDRASFSFGQADVDRFRIKDLLPSLGVFKDQ